MLKASVLVVGGINMDLAVRVPRFPVLGETVVGSGFAVTPGGKGANQAAARHGGQAVMPRRGQIEQILGGQRNLRGCLDRIGTWLLK